MVMFRNSGMMKKLSLLAMYLSCVTALFGTTPLLAEQGDDVRYVPLQPAFIANFGVSEAGNLKYVKAEISIRVSTHDAEMAARYHLPALRNALVLLLSRQDEVSVSTGSGREAIREQALVELRAIMKAEEGQPYIEDLMFTNFVVQR